MTKTSHKVLTFSQLDHKSEIYLAYELHKLTIQIVTAL